MGANAHPRCGYAASDQGRSAPGTRCVARASRAATSDSRLACFGLAVGDAPMKLLVIDDDQRIRDALEIGLQLQWQDAKVLTAADGEAGLDMFFDEEPDIVVLDVTMPRQNGSEVLKALRQVSDVPVIMLTARDEDVDQVRGLELGRSEERRVGKGCGSR